MTNINTWAGMITFCKELSIYQGGEKLVGQVSTQRPRRRPQYQDQVKRHKEGENQDLFRPCTWNQRA